MLLAPVFDRTYFFLEQPVTGTDDIQQHSELRRAYFGLLLSIANANMHAIFASPRKFKSPRKAQARVADCQSHGLQETHLDWISC